MYFDSAYIAKYYVNEPDADAVRAIIEAAPSLRSSAWARIEVASVFHRHVRERSLTCLSQFGESLAGKSFRISGGV
jgi:predicted nucleic acid-binding protein